MTRPPSDRNQGRKPAPTLKEFAERAGVAVFRCDKKWGGTYGYSMTDSPNISVCGYKTESALYKAWAADTFGPTIAKALRELLRP